MTSSFSRSPLQQAILIAGIILIALNLRPALAGVGPLVGAIRDDTGLSYGLLGLLTTLPLLAFGVVSTLTPLFTRRWGIEGTLGIALIFLTTGILLRVIPGAGPLFGGTLLLGIGIALGNVLLSSLVKRDFPSSSGVMTSLYSSAMGIGAAAAAGVSVPLASGLAGGWEWSLGLWAILSMIALLIWIPQLRNPAPPEQSRSFRRAMRKLGSSSVAWYVALFMGLQALAFYVILAWLPEILQDLGMTAGKAGWMLSLSQAMGVMGTLLVPAWAGRIDNQRGIVCLLVILEVGSLVGLMVSSVTLVPLWVSLIGFSLGGSFGLSLLFIVLRAADTQTATELSGMAQSIGYMLAAVGPSLFGALHDWTQTWTFPLIALIGTVLIKLAVGLGAAKPAEAGKTA